jgi:hypothetical protein
MKARNALDVVLKRVEKPRYPGLTGVILRA